MSQPKGTGPILLSPLMPSPWVLFVDAHRKSGGEPEGWAGVGREKTGGATGLVSRFPAAAEPPCPPHFSQVALPWS